MFMGEYAHTIDAKGRVILPADFRQELGVSFVITKGLARPGPYHLQTAGMVGARGETAGAAARKAGGARHRAVLFLGGAHARMR